MSGSTVSGAFWAQDPTRMEDSPRNCFGNMVTGSRRSDITQFPYTKKRYFFKRSKRRKSRGEGKYARSELRVNDRNRPREVGDVKRGKRPR